MDDRIHDKEAEDAEQTLSSPAIKEWDVLEVIGYHQRFELEGQGKEWTELTLTDSVSRYGLSWRVGGSGSGSGSGIETSRVLAGAG